MAEAPVLAMDAVSNPVPAPTAPTDTEMFNDEGRRTESFRSSFAAVCVFLFHRLLVVQHFKTTSSHRRAQLKRYDPTRHAT